MALPTEPAGPSPHEENRLLRQRIAELESQVERLGISADGAGEEHQALAGLVRLLDQAPVGLGFLSSDSRYLAVNRHLAGMNGLSPEEHVGKSVDEVVPFVADQVREACKQVLEKRAPVFDRDVTGSVAGNTKETGHWSLTWFPVETPGGETRVGGVVCEITDRRRMEEALRASEAALLELNRTVTRQLIEIESLYRNAAAGMALVDAEYRFVRVNQRMAEIDGVVAAEAVGRKVPEVVPELWPQLEPIFRRVIDKREPVHDVEIRGMTAARPGEERFWLASYDPVSDAEGGFIGVSVFVHEVTASKRAQETLKQSAQQLQRQLAEIEAIYESAPVGLCVLDRDLRWIRINRRLADINGLSPEAHTGKRLSEVIPEFGPQAAEALEKVVETGEPLFDVEMSGSTSADPGQVRHWCSRWVPIKDEQGQVIAVSVSIEEITEQRRAEERLRKSERLYRAIGESIDYGVWVCDLEGRCTYASESFLKLLGITQEQCSNFGWSNALDAQERERTVAAWKECVERGAAWDTEHRFRGADGQQHRVLARGVPVRDERGEIVCWAGINLDITQLRRAEERLRETYKLESIGMLAGGVAHDFNNLLVGVLGNASLAQEELPAGHPASELMQEILISGERAAHLTRQLLAYAGKGTFYIEALDLSDVAAQMRGLMQPSISRKIELHFELEPHLPVVEADRSQVQQAVMNLVLNGAEAIGSEAGSISVRTGIEEVKEGAARQELAVGELHEGQYIFLEVRDSGPGMDAVTRTRVFDPFFSTKFAGRGLGLAAVSGIVRAHRGALKLATAPGQGTCFTLYFPARGQVSPGVAEEAPAATGAATVLVIDDEESVRQFATKTLERSGFQVLAAANGAAAIEMCRRHPEVGLVLLDLSMPGRSGHEVLPELRKLLPEVPIIVSSGYSEHETMGRFAGQQVKAFLPKPYTSKRLSGLALSLAQRAGN